MASSPPENGAVTPPLEAKANMDNDYDYYIAKYNAPQNKKGVSPMKPVMEHGTPPRPPGKEGEEPEGDDEALLDLAQLEELHHEAERMKALGNKHMAAQVSYPHC